MILKIRLLPLRKQRPKIAKKGRNGLKHTPIKRVKKRRKSGEITKLKKKLWQLCREIQIKRYGNICYCCGANPILGSNCQLGHFIPSSICSVELRYDLAHLRPSCYRCNINLSGNWPAFERHLISDGIDIAELKARNEATKGKVYPLSWFQEKIAEYTILAQQQSTLTPPTVNGGTAHSPVV